MLTMGKFAGVIKKDQVCVCVFMEERAVNTTDTNTFVCTIEMTPCGEGHPPSRQRILPLLLYPNPPPKLAIHGQKGFMITSKCEDS